MNAMVTLGKARKSNADIDFSAYYSGVSAGSNINLNKGESLN